MNEEIKRLLRIEEINEELSNIYKLCQEKMAADIEALKMLEIIEESRKRVQDIERFEDEFARLNEAYDENYAKAEKMKEIDVDVLSEEELTELNVETKQVLANFSEISEKLTQLNNEMREAYEELEKKQQIINEAISIYNSIRDSILSNDAERIQSLLQERKENALAVSEHFLEICAELEEEGVTHPVVRAVNFICTACGSYLNEKSKAMLEKRGFSRCTSCGRIVYVDEE